MNLSLEQIRSITTGAVRIEQEKDGIHFYRFTNEQEGMYLHRNEDFYKWSFSTPGVRLRFRTDSPWLQIKFTAERAGVRSYFAVDISVDGIIMDGIENYSSVAQQGNFVDLEYPCGGFSKRWDFEAGEKEIQLYLPWAVKFTLQELSVADGSSLIPVIPERKALCFGDSITHGADALRPSSRYIARFCDYLGAAECCKAIGGEFFWPELAKTKEPYEPDYVVVAYGTNDWSKVSSKELERNCFDFFHNLVETYPRAELIAISPIWRGDQKEKNRELPLTMVHDLICEALKDHHSAIVLRGYDLLPHDVTYFADLRLHPNDDGFHHYYENLVKEYEKRTSK